MASLGINVPADGSANPVELAADGAKWVRIEAKPSEDLMSWIQLAHSQGVKVLLLLTTVSMRSSWSWRGTVNYWRDYYPDLIDAYQICNEPDAGWKPDTQLSAAERSASGAYPSSWCMDPDDVTEHLRIAREVLGNDAYIVGPGLSSGHPEFADLVDWSPCNAISAHPYGQRPNNSDDWSELPGNFGVIGNLLDGYVHLGKPFWVSEIGVSTHEVSYEFQARYLRESLTYLRDRPDVEVALWFCYLDSMV